MNVNPVFIIGQPRSGTTFLHRTLAADNQNFIAIKHYEWRYPFISFQKLMKYSGLWKLLYNKNYWPKNEAGALASKMHPNQLSDWEEDGIFYEECFLHHFFIFLRFPYTDIFEYIAEVQHLPHNTQKRILRIHQKVIKKIIFMRGGYDKFYLSKEVTSHDKLPQLLRFYPNAKFIIIFRSSEEFLSSLIPLVRYSTKTKTGIDPLYIEGWENMIVQKMKKDCTYLLDLYYNHIPKNSQINVSFKHLISDVASCVESIYTFMQLKMDSEYREYLYEIYKKQNDRERGYENESKNYTGFKKYDYVVKEVDKEYGFY